MHFCQDLGQLTIFGRHQQIADYFLLRIHLLVGLYVSWSHKYAQVQDPDRDLGQGNVLVRQSTPKLGDFEVDF